MKKIFKLTLLAIACMAVACHKEAVLTTLKPIGFTAPVTASATSVTLSATTDSTAVLTLSWPAIVYPVKAQVTYVIQADVPSDTVGTAGWTNAKTIAVGKDVLTKTIKGADLNNMALDLGIAPNTTGTVVFRVQAYQDRFAYTQAVAVSILTYKQIIIGDNNPVLYLPGDYQGWSPPTAPTVAAKKPDLYEGYLYMPAGGTYQFKFTSARDWDHINYGDAGDGKLTVDGAAAGMTLPGAGYYELSANTSTLTWTYTLTTWGIIGDATPGGWDKDTQMTYDPAKQVWTVTCDMLTGKSFKFRANNAWAIDFAITAEGKLKYADSPVYGYDGTLFNLTVPSNGNYTITLDLHDPNNYSYKIHKN